MVVFAFGSAAAAGGADAEPDEPEARVFGPDPDCVTNPILSLDLAEARADARDIDLVLQGDRQPASAIAEMLLDATQIKQVLLNLLLNARDAIEEIVEPFLIQKGFVQRTPRGRVLSDNGYRHLGLKAPPRDPTQLELMERERPGE